MEKREFKIGDKVKIPKTKSTILDIINSYDDILIQQRNGVNPYNVEIAGLHIGCMKDTRKEDWENVYKLLK